MHVVSYVLGLDLAMEKDASALAGTLVQRGSDGSLELGLVYLARWWAPYTQTHHHVADTLSRAPLPGRYILAVDVTGPGLAWFENFKLDPRVRASVGRDRLLPVTITSGRNVSWSGPYLRVGKYRLISELRTALGDTLSISKGLPLLPELLAELDGFEAQVRTTGSLALGNNAKLVAHDDMVVAVALSVVAARVAFGAIESAAG
jgi:hypothetical protein